MRKGAGEKGLFLDALRHRSQTLPAPSFFVSAFVGLMLLFKELWTGHPLEESGLIPYFFRSPIFSSVQSQLTLFFFFTEI